MRSACFDDGTTSFLGKFACTSPLIYADCPSSFGDISVASLENMLRLGRLLHGSSRFLLTCQCKARVYVQFARSTCVGDVLTTAVCSDKRRSKTSLRYLSEAGPCAVQQKCLGLAEGSVECLLCFFLSFFFFFW